MGRRRFVSSLVGAGFSLSAATSLTPDDVEAAAKDQVPIPYAVVPDDEKSDSPNYSSLTTNVPADWYDDLRKAEQVYENAGFLQQTGTVGAVLKPGKFGGRNAYIEVEIQEPETGEHIANVRGSIPEQVDGVPVEVSEVEERKLSNCNEDHYSSSPPAGVRCGPSSSTYGTLASPLFKNGRHFCTNHHLFGGNPDNEKLHQASSEAIGNIVDYDCHDDFVAAEPINGYTPTRDIVDTGLHTWGHYTKTGVQNLAGNSATVHKQGVKTCHTKGSVQGIGSATSDTMNCALREDQVHWGNQGDMGDGDSGSIAYKATGTKNRALVVCLNAGRTAYVDPADYVWGTGAYHIYQQYGYGW